MTDWELLSRYREGSEAAFAELVARHSDWVYSAALRRMRDPQLAEDVTQAAFIVLSRDRKIREGAIMSAWLFQAMRFASANALRKAARRRRHELAAGRLRSEAAREHELKGKRTQWEELAPLLEDAVARLRQKDRQAVLMRFYERKSLAEVAAALGISDEGARKRIARAIEKLRRWFAARGYAMPSGMLATALTTRVVSKMPGSLVIASNANGSAAGLAQSLLKSIRRHHFARLSGAIAAVVAPIGIGAALLAARAGNAPTTATTRISVTSAATTRPVELSPILPATRPTKLTLDEVVAGVRAAEKGFTNLHIKNFRTAIEIMPSGQNQWKPSPMVNDGSAWYGADPLGKVRIYYAHHVLQWEPFPGQRMQPGQIPWMDQEVDYSWNGTEGREVLIAGGFPGKQRRDDQAMMTANRPMMLDRYSRFDTGVAFTLQYLVGEREGATPPVPRLTLGDYLERSVKVNEPPELSKQTVNGFDTVRVRWLSPGGMGYQAYWLDPSRGFALVKAEHVINLTKVWTYHGLEVSELKEVAKGVWFPMRARMVMQHLGTQGEYWRYNYAAGEVTANDSKFDPSMFTAKIPIDYLVSDRRGKSERSYMVMPDGSEHELHRGSTLPSVRANKPQRPDGKDYVGTDK